MPRDIQLAEKVRLLRQFWRQERRAPTYSEMLDLFDYRSKNAVFGLLGRWKRPATSPRTPTGASRCCPS